MTAVCGICSKIIQETGGAVYWDSDTYEARNGAQSAKLSGALAVMFQTLAERRGKIVRHETLYDSIYGNVPECDAPDPHIMSVYMNKLRKRLREINLAVRNERGVGYVLHDMEAAE